MSGWRCHPRGAAADPGRSGRTQQHAVGAGETIPDLEPPLQRPAAHRDHHQSRLEDLDPRIASRLADLDLNQRFEILAPDFRYGSQHDGHLRPRRAQPQLAGPARRPNLRELFAALARVGAGSTRKPATVPSPCAGLCRGPIGWLVFSGTYGCGKTHLAAAIANYQIGRGHPHRCSSSCPICWITCAPLSARPARRRWIALFEQVQHRVAVDPGRPGHRKRHALGQGEAVPTVQPSLRRPAAHGDHHDHTLQEMEKSEPRLVMSAWPAG